MPGSMPSSSRALALGFISKVMGMYMGVYALDPCFGGLPSPHLTSASGSDLGLAYRGLHICSSLFLQDYCLLSILALAGAGTAQSLRASRPRVLTLPVCLRLLRHAAARAQAHGADRAGVDAV